jgi:all-trans-retinol 13,14-reductase
LGDLYFAKRLIEKVGVMNKIAKPLLSSFKLRYEEEYDTIIIGSGMSGLALAAILSKEGEKVLVLERHYVPGGCTHTFKRGHYEWDVGLHYVGEVGTDTELKKIYDYICDTPIEWADMGEVYDKIYFGDEVYEFRKGTENFIRYFSELFPAEKEAIKKYVELLKQVTQAAKLYYAEKAIPDFLNKVIGKWMRNSYMKYASKTTQQVLDELFISGKLKAILAAQFGDYGLPPSKSSFVIHATVAHHYMEGGFYPVGGSRVIYEKIAPVIQKAGGEIFVNAEVEEILVQNGKAIGVRLCDGKIWKANTVISTVGIEKTYSSLLSNRIQDKYDLKRKLEGLTHSIAYLGLYVGFKHSKTELDLPKSNFWIFHDDYDHNKKIELKESNGVNDFPIVYISFPSAKDPDFERRHPGMSTVEILAMVDNDSFSKWEGSPWKKRGKAYDDLKEKISQELLNYLYKYVPQTKGKVDIYELSTPLSVKHFQGYLNAEMYGLEFSPERFKNRSLKPRTPIKNLYLAGQDIVCAGIGGAVMSAILCASAMRNTNYVSKIVKQAKRA